MFSHGMALNHPKVLLLFLSNQYLDQAYWSEANQRKKNLKGKDLIKQSRKCYFCLALMQN